MTLPDQWDGAKTVAYMMLLALVPLIAAVGIAVLWDRWTCGPGGNQLNSGA